MADELGRPSRSSEDDHAAENIEKWKYDAVKRAILDAVPADEEGVALGRLPELVERRLSSDELIGIGSVEQYTTTVLRDLEESGKIERLRGAPLRLLRRTL